MRRPLRRLPRRLPHPLLHRFSFVLLLLPLALLAACATNQPPADPLTYSAEATSSTTVRVTFDRAVGAGATATASYAIRDADGAALAVHAVRATDARTVLLATDEQLAGRAYTLTVENVQAGAGGALATAGSGFSGSSVKAPILASAIALYDADTGVHEVLLTFATPPPAKAVDMADSALVLEYYDITEESPTLDATPDLAITAVRFAEDARGREDRSRVILTTAAQRDTRYTVRVTNLVDASGAQLIDPGLSAADFRGIPAEDTVAPTLLSATATDNTHVLLDFSEPMVGADRADAYVIAATGGAALEVLEAVYTTPYATQVLLTTAPQRDERTEYTVTVTGASDKQGNAIDTTAATSGPDANQATFWGVFRTGPIDGDLTPPRVANTGSTSNTTVLVTFSEPVEKSSAENPAHYRVWSPISAGQLAKQATLQITGAVLHANRTTVTLTTMSQSDLTYTLEVTNVTDLAGNQIAPPDRFHDPSSLSFRGTPPDGVQVDSDCDGLSDAAEQRGWVVAVVNADGSVQRTEVTSDPGTPDPNRVCDPDVRDAFPSWDTDGDGLGDLDERAYLVDPRAVDTDGDGLSDYQELNEVYSEPAQQDTDGDGLADGLEHGFLRTSPLLADTDGDGFTDDAELAAQNRNALIADLPRFDMRVVGDVQLDLDVRFTAESASGRRLLETRTSESSLTTDASRSSESVRTNSTEWFIKANASFEYEPPLDFKFGLGVEGGYTEGTTTSFTSQSARSTQQAQSASLSTDRELETGETVTREVVDATMAVALEIVNRGDIAFTLDNLEIVAKMVDPRDPTRFVPIATLTSVGGRVTVGPAPDARGPIRFVADDPSPALVEQLRENPRNLVFQVANYDVEDEFGRNFSFTYQDVNDRTATLLIDYGGRQPEEAHRVATHSDFDPSGDPVGVTMRTVLEEILGLVYVADDAPYSACLANVASCTPQQRAEVLNSYSLDAAGGLHRLRDVVADPGNGLRWFVEVPLAPGAVLPDDFNDVTVISGRVFRFFYGQDQDGDGLTVQQEAFYGSLDSAADRLDNSCFGTAATAGCDTPDGIPDSRDTDRDGLDDNEEVFGLRIGSSYTPWLIAVHGEDAHTTSASPARIDTDNDGLTDCQELGGCDVWLYVYPNATTAVPGANQAALRSSLEAEPSNGSVVGIYRDASGRPARHPSIAPAWTLRLTDPTDPARFDTDGDGLSDLVEVAGARYRPLDAAAGDPDRQLHPGIVAADPEFATDPLHRDSDDDLLEDGLEVQIGSDPTDASSSLDAALDPDGDGLRNIEEDVGWVVAYRDASGTWRDSAGNALKVDGTGRLLDASGNPVPVDGDGNPLEYTGLVQTGGSAPARATSDRFLADTDGDGLDDALERRLHLDPRRRDTDRDGLDDAVELAGVDFAPDAASPVRFTNALAHDTDGDGLSDGQEATGSWIVQVAGATPYETSSDPTAADADLDGVSDVAEAAAATDPNKADTDGDGIGDQREIASSYGRSPLAPDQVIEFRYANATLLDACYLIAGEASLDGWTAGSNGFKSALRYSRFGGNPGGYVWVQASSFPFFGLADPDVLILTAPAAFHGDRSSAYGQSFTFELRQFLKDGDQTRFDPNVQLTGAGMTLHHDAAVHESTSWSPVAVPLVETAWKKNADGTGAVTEAEFKAVLADVTGLVVSGPYESPKAFWDEWLAGVGFDNPRFGDGTTAPLTDFENGQLASGQFEGAFKVEIPQADGSLQVNALASAVTTLSGKSPGTTVPLGGAVETFVLGREQSFRAFSTNLFEQSQQYTLGLSSSAFADYGHFSMDYDYPVIGGSASTVLRGESHDNKDTCELIVSWSWRVLE